MPKGQPFEPERLPFELLVRLSPCFRQRLAHFASRLAEACFQLAGGALILAFFLQKRIGHRAADSFFHRTARLVDLSSDFVVVDTHVCVSLLANNSRILPGYAQ